MTATDPVSWSGEPAEFDDYAAEYKGGLDNPVKRLLGNSPDQFIAVKARWLMRHEPMLETGGLAVLVHQGRHAQRRGHDQELPRQGHHVLGRVAAHGLEGQRRKVDARKVHRTI